MNSLRNRLQKFLKRRPSEKKLIIINSHDKIDVISGIINGLSGIFGPSTCILCFKSVIPEALEGFSGRVNILNDYIGPEDCAKIDDYVFNGVSKRWDSGALKQFSDIFAYRGVELGRIAEYDLQLYLIVKVKSLAVMAKAVRKEGYNAVFIIDSNGELDGFDNLLRQVFNISCDFVPVCGRRSPILLTKRWMVSLVSDIIDNIAPLFIKKNVNPVRELNGSLTVSADGGFKPPSALSEGNRRLKSAAFSNGVKAKLIDARLFYKLGVEARDDFIPTFFERGLKARLRCLLKGRPYIAFRTTPGAGEGLDFKNLADQFIYDNISYWDVVEPRIRGLVTADFARFRENIDVFLSVAAAHKIKSVTLRNDLKELEKTVVLAAKGAGIPTIVVQHGVLAEYNGHDRIYADHLAVWGGYSAGWYKKFGNDPRKIAITGNPEFEKISNCPAPSKRRQRLVTLISPGQSMFRQTAFVPDDVAERMIKTASKAVEAIGGVDLVVKLHPNENLGVFSKFISPNERSFVSVVDRTDLHKLIIESDAVITMDSTVGLEAVLTGRPLIVMNFTGRPDLIPYVERKVALGVYKPDRAEDAIRKILDDEGTKRDIALARDGFINDFIYGKDGSSKERILRLIEGV